MLKLTRRYSIEAAHQLSAGVPEGHQCRRLHGHRYNIEVDVAMTDGCHLVDGMLLEYAEIDRRVRVALDLVDHHFLNTLIERANGMALPQARAVSDNSTVENFAVWLLKCMEHLFDSRAMVSEVRIEEDKDSVVSVSR